MSLDPNKLSAAKLWLISAPTGESTPTSPRGLPYLAHALYALTALESSSVARMTCDEYWRIYINPSWFEAATISEVGSELVHLTWHLLSDHANRARSMNVDRSTAKFWTIAADMTVANTLDPDHLRPAEMPQAHHARLRPGRSAEEYYASLSGLPTTPESGCASDTLEGCGSGADGIPRSTEYGPGHDVAAVDDLSAKSIRERVAIEYRNHEMRRGSDPGDLMRWVKNILEPQTPWEQTLRAAVKRAVGWAAGRGDYTYSRPSRRASSVPNVVLPGQHRPVPRISIIIDTSASVDDELLARALGEIDGVIKALGVAGSSVTAYSVDAAVHATGNVRSARETKLVGAGGTDLRVGLAAISKERPRPDVVVVLTDGDTPWPQNPPPGAVVVVALLGRLGCQPLPPTPSWAVRVECLLVDD